MNPLLQAIMQMLAGSNPGPNLGGMGAGGSFTPDPASDVAQQIQIGQPLQFPSDPSSMGTGQNPMQMAGMAGMAGVQGTGGQPNLMGQQPLQGGASSMNRAQHPHSSAMSPPTPQSIMQALGAA